MSDTEPALEPVVTAWRAIAASHAAACAALEREMGKRHGLGVSDFEVLERLTESEERKFRAQDLAEAVHLSQSALSRLIDRLEKDGLVERCLCGEDRRGIYVTLTPAGRDYARAIFTVTEELNREIAGRVSPAQLAAADAVLRAALFDDSARHRASQVPPPPAQPSGG